MRIYLGSDHAGYEFKQRLAEHLSSAGHEPSDVGPLHYDAEDDYPPFCLETGRRVVADPGSLGVVIGGSGNGEQIAANKVPGVRAALVWSRQTAQLARAHNDANVMAVGARMHAEAESLELVDAFLEASYSEAPRHGRRIDLIAKFEESGEYPPLPA